ncbi:pilus assembly protein [Salinicola halimionae]|uniref:pilus assembly protein n=1 Tax=Salinicola halimionae TaxID=1949081 RepID=UPI0013003BD2|nr:PilC/PilY family type IV pilus protein [Salinicola halimionae]
MSIRKWGVLTVFCLMNSLVLADDNVPYYPPLSAQADASPRSMLVMSNDHQWFYKAYTDWVDLDGDGTIDSTYRSDIEYYGYFDSRGCYDYDNSLGGGAFKRVGGAGNGSEKNKGKENGKEKGYSCSGNKSWSGNLLNWATMTRIDIIRKALYGGKRFRDNSTETTILERAFLPMDSHSFNKIISDQNVINSSTPFNGSKAVTFCNTTYHPRENIYSGSVTDPPLIRVATGDGGGSESGWPLWAGNEIWQCPWRNERSNLKDYPEKNASDSKEYRARVEVCANTDESDNCNSYPDSAYSKPTGLLHDYANDIEFGMFTGSYKNNKQGGVLRANFENFGNEFDAATGIFNRNNSGIVSNLDAFRIAKYSYQDGNYNSSSGDNCPWGKGSFTNGSCSNWGNPLAEIALEALRYISGESSPTDSFSVGTGSVETAYVPGLTSPVWDNDLDGKWCAAHSMLLVNASEISFDSDDLGKPSSSPISKAQIESQTNIIGNPSYEKLSGAYFVGQTVASANTINDKFCTAKTLGNLGDARGLCPTAPGLEGSYNVAGLARFAHTQTVIHSSDDHVGRPLDTYAVQLASNVPVVKIPIGNDRNVSLIPACANTSPGVNGKCAIVNFQVVEQANDGSSGSFKVDWEDSEFGGDHDMDVKLNLNYRLQGDRLSITTEVTRSAASLTLGLGYILSGTSGRYGIGDQRDKIVVEQSDGFNVHSGINNYQNKYPVSLCPSADSCNDGDGPTTASYLVSGNSGQELQPPLYYAAKYGNDDREDDGTPSAYFEVNRISELADSLRELLDQVLNNTNRTGAGVTLGYEGDVDNYLFQTLYNNQYSWSGDVQGFKIADDGTTATVWSARNKLPLPASRQIITRNPYTGTGMSFSAAAFEDAGLNMTSSLRNLIGYVRGETELEQRNGGGFRNRLWFNGQESARLGDFIGSQPYLVNKPNTYYVPGEGDTSYADFRTGLAGRKPMLYVGGNDGMLHAFDALSGVETLAYIPGLLLTALPELADPDYRHRYYVDGSPTVLDARHGDKGGGEWFSLLSSGLGSGGKGLFALDVTHPEQFDQAHAENIALWEYGPEDDVAVFGEARDQQQLGYIYNQPSIVRLENDRYAVVFGNGYFSESGKASLYILYVDGGSKGSWKAADVVRLTPTIANTGSNGMTTVSLVDRDENGRVDLAYGADIQGNVWRFDLSSSDADTWKDKIHLLFTAENGGQRQILTSTLEIGNHPDGGLMVFFGTGAEETSGLPTSQDRGTIDSFYAIRDDLGNVLRADTLARSSLNGRAFLSAHLDDTDSNSTPIRYLETVSTEAYPENGWYLDLEGDERIVDGPLLRGNRVLFSSLIPGHGMCGAEDSGYLYELNAWYGSAFPSPVLDVNGDGTVDDDDIYDPSNDTDGGSRYVPIGLATKGAIFTPEVSISESGQQEKKISASTGGQIVKIAETPLNNIRMGRVAWRTLE